jgi:hypothetical protein
MQLKFKSINIAYRKLIFNERDDKDITLVSIQIKIFFLTPFVFSFYLVPPSYSKSGAKVKVCASLKSVIIVQYFMKDDYLLFFKVNFITLM